MTVPLNLILKHLTKNPGTILEDYAFEMTIDSLKSGSGLTAKQTFQMLLENHLKANIPNTKRVARLLNVVYSNLKKWENVTSLTPKDKITPMMEYSRKVASDFINSPSEPWQKFRDSIQKSPLNDSILSCKRYLSQTFPNRVSKINSLVKRMNLYQSNFIYQSARNLVTRFAPVSNRVALFVNRTKSTISRLPGYVSITSGFACLTASIEASMLVGTAIGTATIASGVTLGYGIHKSGIGEDIGTDRTGKYYGQKFAETEIGMYIYNNIIYEYFEKD